MKLTINIATRGRPEIVADTVRRMAPHMALPNTTLLVSIDDDDTPSVNDASRLLVDDRVMVAVAPREDSRGAKYDRALKLAPADVYLLAVDFAPVVTTGFDAMILEAAAQLPDGIGCVGSVHPNGCLQAYQAPTAKMAERLGYLYSHEFPFWFIDHELDDYARMIGRYPLVPIELDASRRAAKTIGLRDVAFWATYYDAGTFRRRQKAEDILQVMTEPEWRKSFARNQWPRIEAMSRAVNDSVRANAASLEASRGGLESAPDERYRRIKLKAEATLLDMLAELEDMARAA